MEKVTGAIRFDTYLFWVRFQFCSSTIEKNLLMMDRFSSLGNFHFSPAPIHRFLFQGRKYSFLSIMRCDVSRRVWFREKWFPPVEIMHILFLLPFFIKSTWGFRAVHIPGIFSFCFCWGGPTFDRMSLSLLFMMICWCHNFVPTFVSLAVVV